MLIAGPNLTIDRTLTLAELRPGEVLRFDSAVITPGGKGVNVVRAATALGGDAVLVGLVPGFTGAAAPASSPVSPAPRWPRCSPTRGSRWPPSRSAARCARPRSSSSARGG